MDENKDENLINAIEYLDKSITETKDQQKLNSLLDMKLCSLNYSSLTSKKVFFNSSFISTLIENPDFELLKKISLISDKSTIIKPIIEFINSKHNNNNELNIIKLLNFLINHYADKASIHLSPEFIYGFLICALNNSINKPIAFETLSSYFKIFSDFDKIKCLNKLFEFSIENNNLEIFCALLNFTSKNLINNENCCFNNNSNFWIFIESCISGQESYLQKQGEYILSKYIIDCHNSDHNENSWRAFFILIDIGREKQLHLVAPSLNLFKYIKDLQFLWQKCVYSIYLKHSQTTIVYHVANEILKRTYFEENLVEIFKLLFPAINKNEYSNLSNEMFENLKNFSTKLNKNQLEIVTKVFIEISWNSVSFWKVIQSLFENNKSSKEINLYQEVIICAGNLPHLYIRHKCIEFLIKIFWDENNYEKTFKIASYCLKLMVNYQSFDYLEKYSISEEIIQLFIQDLSYNDTQKIRILKYFKIWKRKLRHHKSRPLYSNNLLLLFMNDNDEIDNFLIDFYTKYLDAENCDLFIDLVQSLQGELFDYGFDRVITSELINKPLFSPEQYNQNQLFVSLSLVCLGTILISRKDIKIHVSSGRTLIISCSNRGNSLLSNIEVKHFHLCNLILKCRLYDTENCTEIFKNMLESQGNNVLCNLYEKLNFLPKSQCIDLIYLLHKNLLQIKRDQYFKTIVIKFIQVLYSQGIYFNLDIDFIHKINSSLIEFSESYPLIRLNLLENIEHRLYNRYSNFYDKICLEQIMAIYLQGMNISKDERTEFNLCEEFICYEDETSYYEEITSYYEEMRTDYYNPNLLNSKCRIKAIYAFSHIAVLHYETVLEFLLKEFKKYFKRRYFPDSAIHYEKLRIIQALVYLVALRGMRDLPELAETLRTFIFDCFRDETNQNCVKQLLNFLLILVSEDTSEWIKSNASSLSVTFLINVMPSIYHLTVTGNEETLENTLVILMPWTMGSQFKLRVYAQYIIKRLLKCAEQKNYSNFLNKYIHLNICINNCIESTGDIFENTLKSDLIFLEDFNPINDRCLGTILFDIPRLNRVNSTEWKHLNIPPVYMKLEINKFSNSVDKFLTKTESSKKDPQFEQNQDGEIQHIQTKITPWKSALENSHTDTKTDFILIASLIEKSQNLGGLSRTCEVFGISNLVFNDAKIIKEKEFKNLSMSSEARINAIEVKIKNLRNYLLSLQNDGYCVIGAEQTAGSKKLNEYQFPKKIALVLGNEKTGIPPDIIPLLNLCLEIPQFGQTRSLNVHVAGATFIWEYAKQHLI